MNVKLPSIASLVFLVLAESAIALASTSPNVKYYENGKRIPTSAQVPPSYPGKEFQRRAGATGQAHLW